MTATLQMIVEVEKTVELSEEFGILGLEIGLIEQFDRGAGDVESVLAGLSLHLGESGGEGGELLGAGGN